MLLAAKMQKQKDAEEEAAAAESAVAQAPVVPAEPATRYPQRVMSHSDTYNRCDMCQRVNWDSEQEHLRSISDRIDECVERATRVEQHWNNNVQAILKLLGHDPEIEKKSYV